MGVCVYMHTSPSGKRYIGITSKKPEYRWNHGNGYKTNKHFYNAILRYGWGNFKHEIIVDDLEYKDACLMEQELIARYKTRDPAYGYNNSIGGESGSLGAKQSAETIAKRRANRVYTSSWAKGKHFTEEHRRKISESNKGKTISPESRKKMSDAKKGHVPNWAGKTRDDAYRASISKPVICVETGIRYFGLMEAERQTGIKHSNISKCLNGKRETAGNCHWEYAK